MRARNEYVHLNDLGGAVQMTARARLPVGVPMWARPTAATVLVGIDEHNRPCVVRMALDGWLESDSTEAIMIAASWVTRTEH